MQNSSVFVSAKQAPILSNEISSPLVISNGPLDKF